MSRKDFDFENERDEIYGKNREYKKKKNRFREDGSKKIRDFKRNFSQENDREDSYRYR